MMKLEESLRNWNGAGLFKAGWRVEIHGSAKHKVKRGGKAFRYELTVVAL